MGQGYKPLIDSGHFLGHSAFDFPWRNLPPANLSKQAEKMVLDISVPGFTKDDLQILLKGNILTVKGNKPLHSEQKSVDYIVEEFSLDSFERKFKLSDEACADRMEAKCENGVLHISFFEANQKLDKKAHRVAVR